MSTKFWRRLAGCIAISGALTAAPKAEFRAGAASMPHARAIVLEDRRGFRAVFLEADFPLSRELSDFVAVQLVKLAGLDRAGIVITGTGAAPPAADDLLGAAAQALLQLSDATVSYDGIVSVRRADGGCLGTLYPIHLEGCRGGAPVHGAIRAAFQMVDVPHGLQTRDSVSRAYPVQAVAIGKAVTVLALGGNAPSGLAAPGRIVVAHANDARAEAPLSVVEAAVAAVLRRVR
jgi:hypothetical protein